MLARNQPKRLSSEYAEALTAWLRSGGTTKSAALYEGESDAGGYAVPVTVDAQIVPLAAQDLAIRKLATVIPTKNDIKFVTQASAGSVAAKAETASFGGTSPTFGQFTLSAFMAGAANDASFEIVEDAPAFEATTLAELATALQIFEENLYVNGSGSGEAQGMIGNVGAGVTGVVTGSDGYASELLTATFDVLSTLKGAYHDGASFLMARATGVALRKAQIQANLFVPVFTRENGQDYLHGYPVAYSEAMPTIAASATPVLFGDFKAGYIIGDRGGSGMYIKILDQLKALEALVSLYLYRRTDGRVRRSEAIQGITLHS